MCLCLGMKVCSFLSSPNRGWLLLLPSPRSSGSLPGRVAFLLFSQSLRLLLHMEGSEMQAGLHAYALPKRALSDPLLCSNLCHKQSVEAHGKELENECVLSSGLDLPSSLNCPFNTQLTCKNLFFFLSTFTLADAFFPPLLCQRWNSSCIQFLFRGAYYSFKFSSSDCLVTLWLQLSPRLKKSYDFVGYLFFVFPFC